MTFFALLAAYCFLVQGTSTALAALAAASLAVLCKEASLLLLPALALISPVPSRRRWILGLGGLLIGLTILITSGSLAPRPAGDPYETVYGTNILWNLLTYSAWLLRFWEYFPERIPHYQAGLAAWGLALPLLLCIAAWRFPKTRRPIAKASFFFVLLLAPVLPLVNHSYLYYLYLPLVPFFLLAGALLGNIRRRHISAGLLLLFVLYSAAYGIRRRNAEIRNGVLEDPILRYAAIADGAIESLRLSGAIIEGDYLFLYSLGDVIDRTGDISGMNDARRIRSALAEIALHDGHALPLFFPAIKSASLETVSDITPDWESRHIYWTYGNWDMHYMGFGREGRFRLANAFMEAGKYEQAKRQVEIILDVLPDHPSLILFLGEIAIRQRNQAELDAAIGRLEMLADKESQPGPAARALITLRKKATDPSQKTEQ